MNENLIRYVRAGGFALIEILAYLFPLVIVIMVAVYMGGSEYQILHLSEWWFVTVFIMFDVIRDSIDLYREPKLKGFDHRAFVGVVGGIMLLSMTLLIFSVMVNFDSKVFPWQDWMDVLHWSFFGFALFIGWLIKAGIIHQKLKSKEVQITA